MEHVSKVAIFKDEVSKVAGSKVAGSMVTVLWLLSLYVFFFHGCCL